MSFFGIKGSFLRFSRKRQDGSATNLGFKRKHLLIYNLHWKAMHRPFVTESSSKC